MTENQVRSAAVLAVGRAIGALKRIIAKQRMVRHARKRSKQEQF